jgi:hypothetical protein
VEQLTKSPPDDDDQDEEWHLSNPPKRIYHRAVADVTEAPPEDLACEKCGKIYKNKGRGPEFYAAHIEKCEG